MRINTIMTAFLILLSSNLQASTPEGEDKKLTLEDCISKALESNYSVIISGNNLEITKNNVTLAPFLPTVTLGSRVSDSKLNQRNYSSQESIDNSVSKSTSVINSASLNWRLFDGLSMFASREKQIELLAQGEFNFRSVVENLIMKISTHYYQIISLQNQVNLLTELVAISQVRYNQALTRYNIGSDSGLEYKQAKIYLNSDSSRLMLQKENLKNGYLELYRMMNIPFDSNYIISDTIIPERQLNLNELLEMALEANTSLNSIRAGERVAQLDTKIATSSRYPTLDLSAGYNYNINRSQLFPSKFNESNGFNWGLSLSIPIFDGNEINRRIKSARIAQESARLNILMEEQNLESELRQLYNLYNNNLKLIEFEQESRESAYLNLEAAMEMYRLGSLSGIEFRDYQLSYLDASDRKLRALYQTKVSEITLHLMAGELFKER
ncbi:MAG TPA: TolC family protein [Rikenellaceae bacterium]|nr:TolC family protein [Rikenellaceae bacterium]